MKILPLAAAFLSLSTGAIAEIPAPDTDVRAPLEAYLRGQATGEEAAFRRAFHPDADLVGLRNGTVTRSTAEEFITRVSRPANAAQPAAPEFQSSIEDIVVDGDVATAKIIINRPTARVVDMMSLVRQDGKWVIVNKTFTFQAPAT